MRDRPKGWHVNGKLTLAAFLVYMTAFMLLASDTPRWIFGVVFACGFVLTISAVLTGD